MFGDFVELSEHKGYTEAGSARFPKRVDICGRGDAVFPGDPEPHVPWVRVAESAELLRQIGGSVVLRRASTHGLCG